MQSSRKWIYALIGGLAVILWLLVMLLVPALFFLVFLLPLPFIILSAYFGWSGSVIALLVSAFGAYLLTQDGVMAIILLYSMIVGSFIGTGYRHYPAAWSPLIIGVLGSLGALIGFILISLWGFDTNWIDLMQASIIESLEQYQLWFDQAGIMVDTNDLKTVAAQWSQMIPFMIIALSVFIVTINHVIARRLLSAWGGPVSLLPPIEEWKVPRSLVIYYIVAYVMSLFVKLDQSSIYTLFVINILPLLTFVLAVQGLSFVFYWVRKKRKSRWFARVSAVLLFVFPPAMYLLNLIGILDLGFPLRKFIRG